MYSHLSTNSSQIERKYRPQRDLRVNTVFFPCYCEETAVLSVCFD
jgi:hypothetical protein